MPFRRESTVTIGLLGLLFVVVAFEYGHDYATTVVTAILALAVEVGLFLSTLLFVREAISRGVNWRGLFPIGILVGLTTGLYFIRPPSVSITTPYAAVVAGVVFAVMVMFSRRP